MWSITLNRWGRFQEVDDLIVKCLETRLVAHLYKVAPYDVVMWHLFSANPEEFEDSTDQFSFKKMLPRDERRFRTADLDSDLAAEREEFTAFLHPEEFDHMKDIVVLVRVIWN